MNNRIEPLDSLRGIAAASVVASHVLAINGIAYFEAHAAVMVFFVLSGAVLALPWARGTEPPTVTFIVRRICRLWPPVVAAMILAVALGQILSAGEFWRCVFLSRFCSANPPLWSLIIEMRVSLIFPILAVIVLKHRISALSFALLAGFGFVAGIVFPSETLLSGEANIVALTVLHFGPVFVFGILLAPWIASEKQIRWPIAGASLAAGAAMICAPFDTMEGMGAVLVIFAVVGFRPVGRLLWWAPLRWTGRVSFSLYLAHWPVAMAAAALMGTGWLALVVGVSTSCLVAEAVYRAVENPSIRLGRLIGSALSGPLLQAYKSKL